MNNNIVDISALIFEFKTQMDIIRKASSVVDSIISKLENVRFVPMPLPPSQMNASTAAVSSIPSLKRKTDEELNLVCMKKQCPPTDLGASSSSFENPNVHSSDSSQTLESMMELGNRGISGTFSESCDDGQFEFAAVKPFKKVFVSRLPAGIEVDVLKRHILKRLPTCAESLVINVLRGKRNADYSSAIISVGRNDEHFCAINSNDFWPPSTVVHQHRQSKLNHGFRSRGDSRWRRK